VGETERDEIRLVREDSEVIGRDSGGGKVEIAKLAGEERWRMCENIGEVVWRERRGEGAREEERELLKVRACRMIEEAVTREPVSDLRRGK
jgi:hypothetical protein